MNSISTEYDYWSNSEGVKDRYMVQVNSGSEFIYYLVSDSAIETVITSDEFDWRQINDYIYWD